MIDDPSLIDAMEFVRAEMPAPLAAAQDQSWHFHAEGVLGTCLDISVKHCAAETALHAALAANREIDRLEALLSTWRGDTELSRLNEHGAAPLSDDARQVLRLAAGWREKSGGAFDERLGGVTKLWRASAPHSPDPVALRDALAQAKSGRVDPGMTGRHATLAGAFSIDLDGIAKGFILDRALHAVRQAADSVSGILISIGGDAVAWTKDDAGWRIGIPATDEAEGETIALQRGAVATSGFGPRDVAAGPHVVGPAISAANGQPHAGRALATVLANSAADADALATAALCLSPAGAIALIESTPGAACRIVESNGRVSRSKDWPVLQKARYEPQTGGPTTSAAPAPAWPIDWRLELYYSAPKRKDREADFRAPYMALWITDAHGKRVRTLYMVGRQAKWQKDNFIWWSSYRDIAEKVIDVRSEPTAPSGQYAVLWDGRDDSRKMVKAGQYTLHLETSRERGQHIHRELKIDIGNSRFEQTLPSIEDSGGFTVRFGHPNDVYEQ